METEMTEPRTQLDDRLDRIESAISHITQQLAGIEIIEEHVMIEIEKILQGGKPKSE